MGEKTRLQMMMRARPRQNRRPRPRQITLVLGLILAFYCLIFVTRAPASSKGPSRRKRPPPEILNNLSLDEEQCNAYFPGLTKEVDDAVAQGPFQVKQTGDLGPLQGRIKDGQVRVPSRYEQHFDHQLISTDRYTSFMPSAKGIFHKKC
jgi:hypothetical protein